MTITPKHFIEYDVATGRTVPVALRLAPALVRAGAARLGTGKTPPPDGWEIVIHELATGRVAYLTGRAKYLSETEAERGIEHLLRLY